MLGLLMSVKPYSTVQEKTWCMWEQVFGRNAPQSTAALRVKTEQEQLRLLPSFISLTCPYLRLKDRSFYKAKVVFI